MLKDGSQYQRRQRQIGTKDRAHSTEMGIKGLERKKSTEVSNIHFLSPDIKSTNITVAHEDKQTPHKTVNPLNYKYTTEETTKRHYNNYVNASKAPEKDPDTVSINSYTNPYTSTNRYANNQRRENLASNKNIYMQNYNNPSPLQKHSNNETKPSQFASPQQNPTNIPKSSVLGSQNSLVAVSVNNEQPQSRIESSKIENKTNNDSNFQISSYMNSYSNNQNVLKRSIHSISSGILYQPSQANQPLKQTPQTNITGQKAQNEEKVANNESSTNYDSGMNSMRNNRNFMVNDSNYNSSHKKNVDSKNNLTNQKTPNPAMSTNTFVSGVNPQSLHFGQNNSQVGQQNLSKTLGSPNVNYERAPSQSAIEKKASNQNIYFNQQTIEVADNISIASNQGSLMGYDKMSVTNNKDSILNRVSSKIETQSLKSYTEERQRSFPRQGSNQNIDKKFMMNDNSSVYSQGNSSANKIGITPSNISVSRFTKDPKTQATREEIELSRSKNKALISVNKEKFPSFLKRLDEMRSTVQLNICYSFTTRLRDIWSSYVKDQKQRNNTLDEKQLMNELTPIEQNFVEFLSARTDMLVNEIRLKYVKDIKKTVANESAEEKQVPLGDPLYAQESELKTSKDQYSTLMQLFKQTEKVEELHIEDLKKKYRKIMDKHVDSYGREFSIKFGSDDDLAKQHLKMAKDYYLRLLDSSRQKKLNPWNDDKEKKTPADKQKMDVRITNRTVQGQDMISKLREELETKREQIAAS